MRTFAYIIIGGVLLVGLVYFVDKNPITATHKIGPQYQFTGSENQGFHRIPGK